MRVVFIVVAGLLATLVLVPSVVVPPVAAQDYTVTVLSRERLTNASVIKLSRAGFDELFIIERIHTSRTDFDTSVEGLIALKQAGVSEDLIHVVAQEDLRKQQPAPIETQPAGSVHAGTVRAEKKLVGISMGAGPHFAVTFKSIATGEGGRACHAETLKVAA
jgi:hypothetical protein